MFKDLRWYPMIPKPNSKGVRKGGESQIGPLHIFIFSPYDEDDEYKDYESSDLFDEEYVPLNDMMNDIIMRQRGNSSQQHAKRQRQEPSPAISIEQGAQAAIERLLDEQEELQRKINENELRFTAYSSDDSIDERRQSRRLWSGLDPLADEQDRERLRMLEEDVKILQGLLDSKEDLELMIQGYGNPSSSLAAPALQRHEEELKEINLRIQRMVSKAQPSAQGSPRSPGKRAREPSEGGTGLGPLRGQAYTTTNNNIGKTLKVLGEVFTFHLQRSHKKVVFFSD